MNFLGDLINAGFEGLGGLFVALSALQCYRDKAVRGIHWATVAFFCGWGYWNIHYYASLEQTYSQVCAYSVAALNTIWLGLIWRYRNA